MSTIEQQELREKSYTEAMRYMDNAKETLKKAGKENNLYNDLDVRVIAAGFDNAYQIINRIKPITA